jgi:dodecin
MARVLRTIEVQAESERSWEDAAAQAVENLGGQLLGNINSIHADSLRGNEGDGEILSYRVEVRVSLSRSQPALATVVRARRGAGHDGNRPLAG